VRRGRRRVKKVPLQHPRKPARTARKIVGQALSQGRRQQQDKEKEDSGTITLRLKNEPYSERNSALSKEKEDPKIIKKQENLEKI